MKRRARRIYTTLWPAFFCAAVIELVVFAMVDPSTLHDLHGSPLLAQAGGELSATTVQSLAFLFFWVAVSAAITTARWLEKTPPGPSARSPGGT